MDPIESDLTLLNIQGRSSHPRLPLFGPDLDPLSPFGQTRGARTIRYPYSQIQQLSTLIALAYSLENVHREIGGPEKESEGSSSSALNKARDLHAMRGKSTHDEKRFCGKSFWWILDNYWNKRGRRLRGLSPTA